MSVLLGVRLVSFRALVLSPPPNIPYMLVKADVFQLPIDWLNALAPLNMLTMVVTADVFQLPIDWLNALAQHGAHVAHLGSSVVAISG